MCSPLADLSITIENVVVTPSTVAKNLGVVLDDRLDFSSHIASTTRACRFFLNNVRRIRPFLSKRATQLLVQALVLPRLDYCNSLLAGLRPQTPPASPERSGQADLMSAEVGPRDPAADRPALAPDCCMDPRPSTWRSVRQEEQPPPTSSQWPLSTHPHGPYTLPPPGA